MNLLSENKFFRAFLIVPVIAVSLWTASSLLKKEERLVLAKPMTVLSQQLPVAVPSPSSSRPKLILQGDRISLNNRTLAAAWSQWQLGPNSSTIRTAIADADLTRIIGVELLSTWSLTQQPTQWFSQPEIEPLFLATTLTNQYRYLDITNLATARGWQVKVDGKTLQINTPAAMVQEIRQGRQPWGERIVLDLSAATPWQVNQDGASLSLQIDAAANPILVERYHPKSTGQTNPVPPATDEENEIFSSSASDSSTATPAPIIPLNLQNTSNQTTIQLQIPSGLRAKVWSLPNPNRLVIDLAPEVMVERDIIWASGLRYRQQMLSLGNARFPVVWLEINPRQSVKLRPIWSNANSLVGITPLIQMATASQAAAAINGGFFNRNSQLPLGAIRRDGQWISSPILNRGAIAWNDDGDFKIGHLSLQEILLTSTGERLPIISVNSGYLERGIALHTPEWGSSYTPLTDNETIITVQSDRAIATETYNRNSPTGNVANKTSFSIPPDGYLLVVRDDANGTNLNIGTTLRLESYPVPLEFDRYPHILGAGPVLLQNRQIVLDAKAEKFRDSFIGQSAYRSAIARTAAGTILIVAIGNRTGGLGPTLTETARIVQLMGGVDALNLDGGSSTSLYLGGQLLNRSPRTAARIHNGLGIFIPDNP